MSSSIKSTEFSDARIHLNVPRVIFFVLILSFPLSLFAATPAVTENADNTMIPDAPEPSVLSVSETVAVGQGLSEAEPVMLSRDLEVLNTAVSVSESGLELEKSGSESTAMIETGGSANQQQDQQAGLTSGVGRAGGQDLSDSASELKSSEAGDLRLASTGADVPGKPVDNVGGLSTQQKSQHHQNSQDKKPHVAAVDQAVEGAEFQHIPIAVVLALIALIGLVPISRRRVTHV